MTPILDPMAFYWIEKIYDIKMLFCILALLGSVGWIILTIVRAEENDEANKKKLGDIKRMLGIAVLAMFFIALVMPGKDTMTRMYISKKLTKENINVLGQFFKDKDVFKDIVEKAKGDN